MLFKKGLIENFTYKNLTTSNDFQIILQFGPTD